MEPLVPEHAGKTHAWRNWKADSRLQQRRLTIRASRLEGSEVEPSRPPEEVAWRSFWRRPRVDRTPRRHALSLHKTTLLFRRASEAPPDFVRPLFVNEDDRSCENVPGAKH